MKTRLERQRWMALLALAVTVPLPLSGAASPILVLPLLVAAGTVLTARRCLPAFPVWLENLSAPVILVVVVAAGGLRFGVLRPVANLAVLVLAVKLPGSGQTGRARLAGVMISIVAVAGVASSTHPALVGYLLLLLALVVVAAVRLVALSLAERGVAGVQQRITAPLRLVAATVVLSAAVAAPLFPLLPRLRSPFAAAPFGGGVVSGFRDAVALHRIGDIKLSRAVVMRVRFPAAPQIHPEWLRFVGSTLQHYRAGAWAEGRRATLVRAETGGRLSLVPERNPRLQQRAEFSLERESETLFVPPGTVSLELPTGIPVQQGPLGALRVPRGGELPLEYAVEFEAARVHQPPPSDVDLEVPQSLLWIRGLALQATAGAGGPLGQALSLESYLRNNFTYSLTSYAPLRRDPVDWFLTTSRQGHCEFFASSMVLMLRSLGVPARLQAGFSGGEPDGQGGVIVRDSHAHAWVIGWVPGGDRDAAQRGQRPGEWRVFDPTPADGRPMLEREPGARPWRFRWEKIEALWDRWVLTFSLSDQVELVSKAVDELRRRGRSFLGAAIGLAAMILLFVLRPRRGRSARDGDRTKPRHEIGRVVAEILRLGQRFELVPAGGTTPRQLARAVETAIPTAAGNVAWLVTHHELCCYGDGVAPGRAELRRAASAVRRALRGWQRERGRGGARPLPG